MNALNLRRFLQLVGASFSIYEQNHFNKAKTGEWVTVPCPLASWTHDSGKDSNPSFAVQVNDRGDSVFNCFTCGGGDLHHLLVRLQRYRAPIPNEDFRKAVLLVHAEQDQALELNVLPYGYTEEEEDTSDQIFSEAWLNSFQPAGTIPAAMAYLKGRQVEEWVIQYMDIRWDSQRQAVCFPLRNFTGQLVGLRGRYTHPDKAPYHVYKTGFGRHTPLAWWGEHKVNYGLPVLMVESVFDVASTLRVYRNVVAPLSVGMSETKMARMGGAYDRVTLFDNGVGGDRARHKISKYMRDGVTKHLNPPAHLSDPGDMSVEELKQTLKKYLPLTVLCDTLSSGTEDVPW